LVQFWSTETSTGLEGSDPLPFLYLDQLWLMETGSSSVFTNHGPKATEVQSFMRLQKYGPKATWSKHDLYQIQHAEYLVLHAGNQKKFVAKYWGAQFYELCYVF
jgi:hypothetical protein